LGRVEVIMLYVFHGTDVARSLEKARHLIDSLRAKRPDATYVPVIADKWNVISIEENLGGQGLFSNKYIVFLDRVTENAEAKEQINDFVQPMNESSNIFVVLEGKLNAELKKAFEKYAEKVVITDLPVGAKIVGAKGDFNVFALADAVGNRNRASSWTVYRQAVDRGIGSESILGTLFWKVKTMVVSGGDKGSAKYSKSELQNLLTRLITLYHDGHRGLVGLELGTEKLLLEL
jgi:DNA polymerase III delta subunit